MKPSDLSNFVDVKAKQHPNPASIVHPDCRLQKDNGKGEPLGRAIISEGQEGILGKLRQLLPWHRKIS
jgi:hypothetical protein